MTAEQLNEAVRKALEEWTLQNTVDGAIIAGFLTLGIIAGRAYLEETKNKLSLRVAIEAWEVLIDFVADLLLLAATIIGLMTINPDIFADVKMALPFCPIAFILLAAALVIRLFHGGSKLLSPAWILATGLIALACLLNWFGFTFVMEAAGHEWLDNHPSPTWEALRSMRSNLNPELSMTTFLWAHPAMVAILAWAVAAGLIRTSQLFSSGRDARQGEGNE